MIIPGSKDTALLVQFPLIDSSNRPDYKTSATGLAAKVSSYNASGTSPGAWAAADNDPPGEKSDGYYYLVVSATEMGYDYIDVNITGSDTDNQTIKIDTTLHQQLAMSQPSDISDAKSTPGKALYATVMRDYNKSVDGGNNFYVYKDGGTATFSTQSWDTGTRGEAS